MRPSERTPASGDNAAASNMLTTFNNSYALGYQHIGTFLVFAGLASLNLFQKPKATLKGQWFEHVEAIMAEMMTALCDIPVQFFQK